MALILLTNDDGIEAEGLRHLQDTLADLAEVLVVAPDRERSAVSHGLTIHAPLDLKRIDQSRFTVNGTPADCIIYALAQVVPQAPDLIISGINHGANLGEDIMYSGTVAAAREASKRGIAAIAVSQASDQGPIRFKEGAKFVRGFVRRMLEQGTDSGICLNINIPVRKIKGVKITRQACAAPFPHFNTLDREASAGSIESMRREAEKKSAIPLDYEAIVNHYVSVTPLQRDQTDYTVAAALMKDGSGLFSTVRIPGIGLIR